MDVQLLVTSHAEKVITRQDFLHHEIMHFLISYVLQRMLTYHCLPPYSLENQNSVAYTQCFLKHSSQYHGFQWIWLEEMAKKHMWTRRKHKNHRQIQANISCKDVVQIFVVRRHWKGNTSTKLKSVSFSMPLLV